MASVIPLYSHDSKNFRSKFDDSETLKQYVEDITIIWLDQSIEQTENQHDIEKTKTSLRQINDYVIFYSKPDPCIDYIKSVGKEKIFLITSGAYARDHIDKIHQLQQIDSIFIYCCYRANYLPLKEKYTKVVEVYTELNDLMESLNDNIESVTKQAAVFGLFDSKQRPTKFLTKESASFLWFQLLTDVLKTIALSDKNNAGIQEMLHHCQSYYRGNRVELNFIEQFRKQYKPEDAIVWYSKQSFVYRLVNKALRTEDIDALYTFRIYITHLRTQIANEYDKLRRTQCNTKTNVIHLFRGLKMSNAEINQMFDNVGGLISMNAFFSTSRDIEQAIRFAIKPSHRKDVVGVLLQINGDVNCDRMIFADIAPYSAYPKEQEVLFDLGTIFRIVHIEYDKPKQLWIMQLTGVEKLSYLVSDFIKSIGQEKEESNATLLLSRLMCDMGEYGKSIKYLKRLLSTLPMDHTDRAKIYFYLGRACYFRGESKFALDYYDQAVDLQKRQIAPEENSLDLAQTLHNIANIYFEQEKISKAQEYYEKALEMKRAVLQNNPNHPSIATTLAGIASIYREQGDYNKALELTKQAYEIKKLSLVPDHPSIADSLNSLGLIYQKLHDYEQATDCLEKALSIKKITLPPTHPSLSITLNSIGWLHHKKGDYNEALVYYTTALEIQQTALLPDNLDLVDTYNNLCSLYYDSSEYDKALEMAKCKLNILRRNFSERNEKIQTVKDEIDDILQAKKQPSIVKKEAPYSIDIYF